MGRSDRIIMSLSDQIYRLVQGSGRIIEAPSGVKGPLGGMER